MKELRTRRSDELTVDLEGPQDWNRGDAWDDDAPVRRPATPDERERTSVRPR